MRAEDNALISTGKANMVEAQPHRIIKNVWKRIQVSCVITGFEVNFAHIRHSPCSDKFVDYFITFNVQVIVFFCVINLSLVK